MARSSEFTQKIADDICEKIADGASLRKICKGVGMPNRCTVFVWLAANPSFQRQYAQAVAWRADGDAEDVVEIADTEADPQKARVRIDARKWRAGQMAPKKYGNRMALTGANGGPIQTMDLTKLSDDDLSRLEAILGPLAVTGGDQGGEGEAEG